MGKKGNRPDRHARRDPVRACIAQDKVRQDHAEDPAQDRRGGCLEPRRHLDPGRSRSGRSAGRQSTGDGSREVARLPRGDADIDANDGADADRRVERRPEVELVRRVGTPLGSDDAAERCGRFRRGSGHDSGREGLGDSASPGFGGCTNTIARTDGPQSPKTPRSLCAERAEKLFAVTDAVHHLVPPRVRQRQRHELGENPPRHQIRVIRDRLW